MNALPDSAPVLIALLPRPRDLALVQEQGFYRVPVAHAPASLDVARALAFYQPASFEDRKWRIEWWAPIQTITTALRAALLPEEPDHPRASDLYYRVGLGPVQPFEPPLVARAGRRLLFMPTTWGRLRQAGDLSEARRRRPIADDPFYLLIRSQLDPTAFAIGDEDDDHQLRLFREGTPIYYEAIPDW